MSDISQGKTIADLLSRLEKAEQALKEAEWLFKNLPPLLHGSDYTDKWGYRVDAFLAARKDGGE